MILDGLDLTVRSIVNATIILLAQKELESVMSVKITLKVNSVINASLEVMEMPHTAAVWLVTVMDMPMRILGCVIRRLGR